MATTLLSTLLSRMNRFQTIFTIEEQYKVRDLDDALRTIKRTHDLPFYQKKGSLKVFEGVYQYKPADDHDYLIYLDYQQQNLPFGDRFRGRYTSMRQFWEDPDYRNQTAEIWSNNKLTLGVHDKTGQWNGLESQQLDSAQSTTNHTASADASNLQLSYVNFITGAASIQVTNTNTTNAATVSDTFGSFTDANYAAKWYFRWVFSTTLPASITLKFGVDSSNYLYGTVTEQFDGQPLIANQWNFVAFDLNAPTGTVGTINTSSVFAYESITLNSAATGLFYLDSSYLKAWEIMDYWYYSKYAVQTNGATQPDQQYFFTTAGTYSTSSSLVGDEEWADVVMYDAMCSSLTDKENMVVLEQIKEKRALAWDKLTQKWPDAKPQITTDRYRWTTDYTGGGDWGMGGFIMG